MNWNKALFLHTGWTVHYDGNEAPEGGHAYLKQAVGVEAENFRPVDGWCYGYAPVSRTSEGRSLSQIPKASRTVNITKLGAVRDQNEIDGITIVWTARRPDWGPVVVGIHDNATVFRYMPGQGDGRPYITKANVDDCFLIPERNRTREVTHKKVGFPGMAASWFPGIHQNGPAKDMLAEISEYLPTVRAHRLGN